MSKAKDITGMVFGRLKVLRTWMQNDRRRCDVICTCGTTKSVDGYQLRSGRTKSCGCLQREITSARNIRHGAASRGHKTAMYEVWIQMVGRCTNPNNKAYANYGGRGIAVCERWRQSFDAFKADMGERPSRHHSIDRINNSGNYEPTNCRWATPKQQCRNQRKNVLITYDGVTLTASEWIERLNAPWRSFYGRIERGWPADLLITTPFVTGNRLSSLLKRKVNNFGTLAVNTVIVENK